MKATGLVSLTDVPAIAVPVGTLARDGEMMLVFAVAVVGAATAADGLQIVAL